MSGQNAEIVNRWFEEVWNKGRADAIDEMLASECSVKGLEGGDICCCNDFKVFHENMNDSIGNIHVSVEKIIEQGENVSGIFTFKGVHKASNKDFAIKGAFYIVVREGEIVEAENIIDFMPMLVSIGLLPENAVPKALAGEAII